MTDEFYLQAAAIVCREVAVDHAYILYAERSEPVEEADSGWQFLCGRTTEDPEAAQVWALREVLAHDPSLGGLVGLPPGTVLTRSSRDADWTIEHESQ